MGPQGATTTPWSKSRMMDRYMREKQFAKDDTIKRIFESMRNHYKDHGKICGRLARFYFSSFTSNLTRSPITAMSRLFVSLRFVCFGIFRKDFFAGLRGDII